MSGQPEPLGVVFDCMVFLQAAANRNSPSARVLALVEVGEIKLFVSEEILNELREVLSRPKVRSRLKQISDADVIALYRRLDRSAYWLRDVPRTFQYSRDPKDELYINLAVAAGAAYLVSRDTDLVDLMTGSSAECKEFRQRFRGLKIIDPPSLLTEIQRRRELVRRTEGK
jgi:putative PIN family toxin of toxin-antitoxin system